MKNKVELIGFYGNDEIIACSAWTSTSRNLTDEKRARIPAMINTLWSQGHETPFEKGVVHFLVDTDIASHIHFLKHRISSFNGESARYKELKEDKVYIPEDWQYIYLGEDTIFPLMDNDRILNEIVMDCGSWADVLNVYNSVGNKLYHASLVDVEKALGRKRAKESCRFFKTYSSQIEGDVCFNMRSFANFQKLRNDEHAQLEIRELAQEMLSLVENLPGKPFQHTLAAFANRNQK